MLQREQKYFPFMLQLIPSILLSNSEIRLIVNNGDKNFVEVFIRLCLESNLPYSLFSLFERNVVDEKFWTVFSFLIHSGLYLTSSTFSHFGIRNLASSLEVFIMPSSESVS